MPNTEETSSRHARAYLPSIKSDKVSEDLHRGGVSAPTECGRQWPRPFCYNAAHVTPPMRLQNQVVVTIGRRRCIGRALGLAVLGAPADRPDSGEPADND